MSAGPLESLLQPDRLLGVLTRAVEVRLLNCSASGCLAESTRQLAVGTIASLRLALGDREFVEDVQVVRCQQIEGAGSLYHVGAKFLWTAVPGERSLRRAMHAGGGDFAAGFSAEAFL